jgi:type IV pilus assembly protein PilY1
MGRPAAPLTGAGGIREINDHIQEALLAIRPYGATPLAGMFEDARTFFRTDVSKDPLYPTEPFAPAGDPYFGGGCRKTYIIVLSDGEPNLDLRPYCETQTPAPAGKCPFAQPWEIAHDLANPGNPITQPAVRTFAVGFGLSVPHDADGHDVDCSTIVAGDFDTAGRCVGATGSLRACCTLARIALEGDTTKAYFADTPLSLQTALSDVLSQIAAGSTSRTMPSFASGTAANSSSDAPAKAYQFVSSFEPMTEQILWEGNLERKRWVCKTQGTGLVATLDFVPSAGPGIYVGDDFAYNLNNGQTGHPRTFLTVVGGASTDSTVYSTHTIRPKLPLSDPDPLDGLSTYRGTTASGDRAALAAEMGAHSTAMGIPVAATAADMLAECKDAELAATSSADCATRVMNWELGGTNTGVTATRAGHELGAIYHSTPALHGRPDEFLRDESYSLFAHEVETRPLMLYTATTDGQLHAFKVASNGTDGTNVLVDGPENNELWSFLPPYVLPGLLKQYPRTQQILLDGEPVVKDVILERTAAQAQAGSETGAATWRTVLVAGGGQAGGFYYALDVTNPTAAAVTDSTKPFFLWQLSTDEPADATDLPQPLFGSSSAVPAVATIAYRKSSSDAIKEIAVAILPGGEGKADGTDACLRHLGIASTTYGHISPYPPRTSTRCWLEGPARSLTIVRLSDGKVLKTFRGHEHDGPATIEALVELVDFDAPITGTPVPYPSRSGQVSDRIYVGDADGTLWRVNLASPDPALWDVHIAFDAYPLASDADSNTQHFGQPVDIPPVVSVDGIGNTIVLFATGDQNDLTTATTGMKTRLWSLTETPATPATAGAPPFKIKPNWALQFAGGKRVTGPIALFDTVAYFSTFAPSGGADACVDGNGAIWGVDYLKSTAVTGQPNVPVPRLPTGTGDVSEKVEAAGVVVFGVAVSQQPSCYTPDDTVQDWYGTHTRITKSTAPVYQLVYQTGAGGTASGGVKTNTKSQVLPPLRELTRIDSWASIVE